MRRTTVLFALALVAACKRQTAELASLEEELRRTLDSLQAETALYAKNIPTGRAIAIRADRPMNALSVIKVPIMIQAFRDVEAGRLRLADRYVVRPEDLRGGSGILKTFDQGLTPSYRDLIEQMIITSDNTATDILIRVIGTERINAALSSWGFRDTRLRSTTAELFKAAWVRFDSSFSSLTAREVYERGFPKGARMDTVAVELDSDSTRWLGRTTANEMGRLLEELVANKYTSAEYTAQMVAILKRQMFRTRIPGRLGLTSAEIANKTGSWAPVAANDVAVIFHDGGPTVITLFARQNRGNFWELEAAMARIAERLVQEWR